MASFSSSTKVTLKLLIDTKNEKVLFAEASKAVVDFLFNMLCLPIGTVVKLLSKDGMVGSIGNLYHSVENMNENYMQPDQTKDVLLNPIAPISSTQISGLLLAYNRPPNTSTGISAFFLADELENEDEVDDEDYEEEDEDDDDEEEEEDDEDEDEDDPGRTSFYTCPTVNCSYDVTRDNKTLCSRCKQAMNRELRYVGRKVGEENIFIKNGFVKDIVTFMVMDDLVIQPMPTLSSITLLNKFNIKDIGTLQEKVVELGVDEGIKLLKASLQSKMVLTNVFIKKDIDM